METLNMRVLDFFSTNYKPGLIALVGTNDAIGPAIREAQSLVTKNAMPSLWSHCFILDDLRLDRRGHGNTKTKSPYIFESNLKVDFFIHRFAMALKKTGSGNGVMKK